MSNGEKRPFNLRVVPWFTDGCSTFLSNIVKWLPNILKRPMTALEFGGGNSTLFLLGKGLKVTSIESDDGYIGFICGVAENVGYKATTVPPHAFDPALFADFDLVVMKPSEFDELTNIINKYDWDLVIDDGLYRRELLLEIHEKNKNTIFILDNAEYCANWGRLDRGSAKPDLIKAYRGMLRDRNWSHYVFEQPEGRDGRGGIDKCGWESPHRWASAVLWPNTHLFAKLIVSNIGFPLVNELGADDLDTETLSERCPFDWAEMKWLKPHFPSELDLKLDRNYD